VLSKEQHREYAAKVAFGQAEQLRRIAPTDQEVRMLAVRVYTLATFVPFPDIDNDYREFMEEMSTMSSNIFKLIATGERTEYRFFDFGKRGMNPRSIHADVHDELPGDFKPFSFVDTPRENHEFDKLFDNLRSFARDANIAFSVPKVPDHYTFDTFVPQIGAPDFSLLAPIDVKGVNLKQSDIGGEKKPDLLDTYVSAAFIVNEHFGKVLTFQRGKQRKLNESGHAIKYSFDLLPQISLEEVDVMKAVRDISEHPPKDNKEN